MDDLPASTHVTVHGHALEVLHLPGAAFLLSAAITMACGGILMARPRAAAGSPAP